MPKSALTRSIIEVAAEMNQAGLLPSDYWENFPLPVSISTETNLSII